MISYFIIHVKHRSRKCLQCEVYFILFFMPLYNASCLPRLYRKYIYIYIYISIKKKIIGTKMKIGQLEDGNSNLLLYFYNLIVRIKE